MKTKHWQFRIADSKCDDENEKDHWFSTWASSIRGIRQNIFMDTRVFVVYGCVGPKSQSWLKSFGRTSCESVTPDVSQSRNQSFERSFRCLDMMMFMVTMVMSRPVVMMVTMMMIYRTMVMMFMVTMMMQRSAVLPHEQVQSGGDQAAAGDCSSLHKGFHPRSFL